MTGSIELSIVIPAFREGRKIERDIRAAAAFLRRHVRGAGEICVVDDGSPDDTEQCARALMHDFPELRVFRHAPNRGKGYALRVGVAAARGRRIMFADAGGCVPYEDARAGLELVERGVPFAHGSRRIRGAVVARAQPWYRRVGSRVFRWLVGRCMGVPAVLRDTQCGFKVYDGDAARRVFDDCVTDGYMLDMELILRARRKGMEIREFPVRWRNDADSRFRPVRGSWRNLRDLVRIRLIA